MTALSALQCQVDHYWLYDVTAALKRVVPTMGWTACSMVQVCLHATHVVVANCAECLMLDLWLHLNFMCTCEDVKVASAIEWHCVF